MKDKEKYSTEQPPSDDTHFFLPEQDQYIPVNDVREKTKQESERYAPTKSQKQAFYGQRIKLVEASETEEDGLKKEIVQDLKEQQKALEEEPDPPTSDGRPVPGGLGFGIYYKPGELRFNQSSTLYYRIVVADSAGDPTNEWLYLTSTNRAPKGVEAYVAYEKLNEPQFVVFDWSKNGDDRWVVTKPRNTLTEYIKRITVQGQQYDTIYVYNRTRRIGPLRWKNEVGLLKKDASAYDLVYSNEYDLTPIQENEFLWWGPIVETFHPFPDKTSDIGFFETRLQQDTGVADLLSFESTVRKSEIPSPHRDFDIVFERGADSFIVH